MQAEDPEISDVILSLDPETGRRQPVYRHRALARLRAPVARRVVAGLPVDAHDRLLPEAVDQLLIEAHLELQRLEEEFFHGPRVAAVLGSLLAGLPQSGRPRVVDVGCGLGFVIRWLAAAGAVEAELLGVDMNPALIGAAEALARREQLPCRFIHGDAFALPEPATIYMSTGVLHHFRGDSLVPFFRRQAELGCAAFVHFDIQPSWLAPLGAWLFHQARMRNRLARYDGVASAVRAWPIEHLARCAAAAAPGYRLAWFNPRLWWCPVVRTMQGIVAVRTDHAEQVARGWSGGPLRWL